MAQLPYDDLVISPDLSLSNAAAVRYDTRGSNASSAQAAAVLVQGSFVTDR